MLARGSLLLCSVFAAAATLNIADGASQAAHRFGRIGVFDGGFDRSSPLLRRPSVARSSPATIGPAPVVASGPEPNMIKVQMDKMGTYVSEGIQRVKLGMTGLWHNWGLVREIKAREKKGAAITINDFLLIQRDRQDSTKLLHMLAVYALSPNLLPYYIIFYNRALPTTFDLEKDRANRFRDMKHARIAGVLQMLQDFEKGAINDKDPRLAEKGAAEKDLVKSILEAPSWQAAVEHLGHGLVYNASAYKPDQKRKTDMGGVPAAVIKGANMALGAPLNFLPAFVLKFQVKSALWNMHMVDDFIIKAGPEQAIASLSRHDLLSLCMDRCVGDPADSDAHLRLVANNWIQQTELLQKTIKEADPANKIFVCPFRTRLALLGVNAVLAARSTQGGGCLARALYTGKKSVKLGY